MNPHEYYLQNKKRFLDELKDLLKIPSISAQKEFAQETRNAAEWIKNHLEQIGMEKVQILETGGHPVIYAEHLKAKNKPTVLIYGHYDVQAPDPLEDWETPPFEPTERNGNLYARGMADDKGQLFVHIKAIESILKTTGALPINVKFLLEGEEEIGGVNLDEFIKNNKELLKSDFCLISDSHSISETLPLIGYGLRGIVYSELGISVMSKDVHSGQYGGNVPNAAHEMAKIISKLKNFETEEILIPGFYENVRQLSDTEIEELENAEYNEKSVLEETGAKKVIGVEGFSPAARAGARPTLDINGTKSGYTDEGPKTIIPAKAMAKISMRIVPNQTVTEIKTKYEAYLKKIIPEYVAYELNYSSDGEPIIMNRDSVYFKNAEVALEKTFGNKPVYELEGGSIPVTATLKTLLGIDSILMGFGLPDDGLHSPNEKMSINMFYKGIETVIQFFLLF